ncbi:MAG: DUF4124 domain-containing protein [Myxococcota bacterium]
MLRHAARSLLALALALAPASADAALYRWVDEQGVTHYATDLEAIPSSARDTALEIVTSPAPVAATRALPVRPATPAIEPTPPPAAAPAPAPPMPPIIEPEPPAPIAIESPPLEPETPELPVAEPATAVTPPASSEPSTATEAAPASEPSTATPGSAPLFPGPAATRQLPPDDPRAAEVAELEAKIAADRETLRQMISTKRWDSAELASDPNIRAIAERLPRLQAELAALRAETVP